MGAHSHSRSTDVFLHPRDLAISTKGVYAPKLQTAFTAYIKRIDCSATISGFHNSCVSDLFMWV
jgi:hypothetical protein